MDIESLELLDLSLLEKACGPLDKPYVQVMCGAAAVSFASQSHSPGVALAIEGDLQGGFQTIWPEPTEAQRMTYDPHFAAEHGAYLVAIGVIYRLTALAVLRKSVIGTGFDFWLIDAGKPRPPMDALALFQDAVRLEVSGTWSGDVRSRLIEKIRQVSRGGSKLPAYVAIVDFAGPRVVTRWIS